MNFSRSVPWATTVRYSRIKDEDTESQDERLSSPHSEHLKPSSRLIYVGVGLTILFGVAAVFILIIHTVGLALTNASADLFPSVRHEWRSLSPDAKLEYISAVQCLRTKPSRIRSNQTLYDDFPWVHAQVGAYSHNSAAFLAWHRRFISVYERTLQDDCSYAGRLPYWDWTLDWQNITAAPVWHEKLGFGDYGIRKEGPSFLHGYCVTTGPFANLEVLYVRNQSSKHCLSRGLVSSDDPAIEELISWIQPPAVADILAEDGYEKFNLRLEQSAHNSIPRMIRGDFAIFSAPYDPIFFLHHAQLDRLWFQWQQLHPQYQYEYAGLAARNSSTRASLHDILPLGGLAPDVEVATIMDTQDESLSYIYS